MRMEVRAACAATVSAAWENMLTITVVVDKPQISVETLGGIKYLDMRIEGEK